VKKISNSKKSDSVWCYRA